MKSKTLPSWIINLFFVIGLVSALLFRLLIFFNYYYSWLARYVWYAGVTGYLLFFGFRYYISRKRRRTILQNDLIEKVAASDMDDDYREEVIYLLQSIIKSKEMFNYVFIFAVSFLAIVLDIVLSLIK